MIVVSNASPLITLARIGCHGCLHNLFTEIQISTEVYTEVAIGGAGKPGADAVAQSPWIKVKASEDSSVIQKLMSDLGLGAGEVSAVLLAKQLRADLLLMDERKARRFAQSQGLPVLGCIGLIEEFYRRREISDLRQTYLHLLQYNVRVDIRTLQTSLKRFDAPLL